MEQRRSFGPNPRCRQSDGNQAWYRFDIEGLVGGYRLEGSTRRVRWARPGDRCRQAFPLGIGTLHLGVVVASAGDRALGIVDGQASRHAVEPLERPAVTPEPRGDLLVGDDLGVGVTRPGQRHHEDPGAQQLTGSPIDDLRTLAEVDLRRLAGVELKDRGHLWVSSLEAGEEAAHRGVRAGEAVAAHQGAVDGGALDALTPPTLDPLAMRLRERGDRGPGAHRAQVHGKLRIPGQRRGHVEPSCRLGGAAKLGQLAPTHQSGTRNGAVGIAQPHASKYLTNFEHLEPPVGHRLLPSSDCAGEGTGGKRWSETSAQHCPSGSIKANIEWLHIGGHRQEQAAKVDYTVAFLEEPTHGQIRIADFRGHVSYTYAVYLRALDGSGDLRRVVKNTPDMNAMMENLMAGGCPARDTSMVDSFDRQFG